MSTKQTNVQVEFDTPTLQKVSMQNIFSEVMDLTIHKLSGDTKESTRIHDMLTKFVQNDVNMPTVSTTPEIQQAMNMYLTQNSAMLDAIFDAGARSMECLKEGVSIIKTQLADKNKAAQRQLQLSHNRLHNKLQESERAMRAGTREMNEKWTSGVEKLVGGMTANQQATLRSLALPISLTSIDQTTMFLKGANVDGVDEELRKTLQEYEVRREKHDAVRSRMTTDLEKLKRDEERRARDALASANKLKKQLLKVNKRQSADIIKRYGAIIDKTLQTLLEGGFEHRERMNHVVEKLFKPYKENIFEKSMRNFILQQTKTLTM